MSPLPQVGTGWIPDKPDSRDLKYNAPDAVLNNLKPQFDLAAAFPNVSFPIAYSQGDLKSCTANALCGLYQYEAAIANMPLFRPSILFIYYNQRNLEKTTCCDSGAGIRDGLVTINTQGMCSESAYPYLAGAYRNLPGQLCFQDALNRKIKEYRYIEQEINQLKGCLADGHPFAFGFSIFNSFFDESPTLSPWDINMPQPGESIVYRHAAVVVGYDDNRQRFTIRNSWGNAWGDHGYFTLPYTYLLDPKLSQNFWMIELT